MKYNSPITISAILAYPTVKTGCILCDAVAETLQDTTIKDCKMLAARMGQKREYLSGAIRVQTGIGMAEFLKQVRILKLRAYLISHPAEDKLSVARRFGFSGRNTLRQFIKKYVRV